MDKKIINKKDILSKKGYIREIVNDTIKSIALLGIPLVILIWRVVSIASEYMLNGKFSTSLATKAILAAWLVSMSIRLGIDKYFIRDIIYKAKIVYNIIRGNIDISEVQCQPFGLTEVCIEKDNIRSHYSSKRNFICEGTERVYAIYLKEDSMPEMVISTEKYELDTELKKLITAA